MAVQSDASEVFRPAWWLRGGHAQTLFASLVRRRIDIELRRERLELPDGDFLDLDWHENVNGSGGGPLVEFLLFSWSTRSILARFLPKFCSLRRHPYTSLREYGCLEQTLRSAGDFRH